MRKIIMLVIGSLAAIVGFALPAIGVTDSNLPGAIGALTIVLSYAFFEAHADAGNIADLLKQTNKFQDPAFWTGLIGAVLVFLSGQLGWNLPLELIAGVLAVVMPFIIKLFRKTTPDPVLIKRARNRAAQLATLGY